MRLILITAHPKNTPGLFGQAIQSLINNLLYLCRKDLIRFKVLQCNDSTGQLPSIDLGDFIRNVLPDLLVSQMVNAFMFDSGQYDDALKITRKLTYRLLKSTDRDLSLRVILNSLTTSEFRFSVIQSSHILADTVRRLRKWLLTPFSALVLRL